MSIASVGHGWTILSRLSQTAPRRTAATFANHYASRSPSKLVDFVSNTTKLNPATDHPIFEDELEDDAKIDATPKTPYTISCIEAKLPLRLPDPVVSDWIFENFPSDTCNDDYAAVRVTLRRPPSSAYETLLDLVSTKKYQQAWELCQEMLHSNIEIPRSNLFASAAVAALHSNSLSEADKVSQCLQWLSMILSAREDCGEAVERIKFMRRSIFQVLHPTMTLAIKFSLVVASKGYAESISPEAITCVTRYASPSVSLRFVKDFLHCDFTYFADVDSGGEEGLQETREEKRLRRSQDLAHRVQRAAIETLARSGEFDAAMSLLPTSQNPFRLPTGTYDLLLSRLQYAKSYPDYMEWVEKLRSNPLYYIEALKQPSDAPIVTKHIKAWHSKFLADELDPTSHLYIGKALAVQLQSLLDSLDHSELSVPELLTFFKDYLESGRTTAIYRLRKLALAHSWPMGGVFLYAEMSYYLGNGLHLLVLRTYANFFYFSGVPESEIAAAMHFLQQSDRSHPAYFVRQMKSVRKWIPTESHTDLVWHSLARSTPHGRSLENLYHRFIEYQLSKQNDETSENATLLHFPRSIRYPVSTSLFTVFISRILVGPHQAGRASQFFRDMVKLGVNPTIHHYTLLATFFVTIRDAERAFLIVKSLEQAHPVESRSPMQESLTMDNQPLGLDTNMPCPDVKFYTSILSSFTKLGYLSDAQAIRKLFLDRFIYTEGLHRPLDIALAILQRYEQAKEKRYANTSPS